jgi:ectoine hydroxylase-related dioxygenase (phytanoyl-CoA dioxygenase family)
MEMKSQNPLEAVTHYLQDRQFASWREEFDERGFVIFERVLPCDYVENLRSALAPYLVQGKTGRSDFEGFTTNRVYALLAKSPLFAELVTHPLALAFAEAELGPTCLLSACLAINLRPGETVQPWHFDDSSIKAPRPRASFGVSTFWAIDDTTEFNGATEVIPGSHLWGDTIIDGAAGQPCFSALHAAGGDLGSRSDTARLVMPAGSLAIAKGTLWHRGGANRSDTARLIITPQYCVGWARQIENMTLAVPPEIAATLPERARGLFGYSVHPPFIGYVDGLHPRRLLAQPKRAPAPS